MRYKNREPRHFHEGKAQCPAHLLVSCVLEKRELVYELLWIRLLGLQMADIEVQQAEEEYRFEVIIPFAGLPLLRDGSSGIEDSPFHEVRLVSQLCTSMMKDCPSLAVQCMS